MQLDNWSMNHLRQWAERHAPTDDAPEKVVERICHFLSTIDTEDATALIDRGWTAVFDAMTAIPA